MPWVAVGKEVTLNGLTEVTLVDAPASGKTRLVVGGVIFNYDTVQQTILVRKKKAGVYSTLAFAKNLIPPQAASEPGGRIEIPPCSLDATDETLVAVQFAAVTATAPSGDVAVVEQTT
jgi:hypothetical protein